MKLLVELETAEPQAGDAICERPRRVEHEIVAARSGCRRSRSPNNKAERFVWYKRQPIADIGKRHQTFDFMIAVRPPSEHVQREIDFGGSELGEFACTLRP